MFIKYLLALCLAKVVANNKADEYTRIQAGIALKNSLVANV